MRPVRRVLIRLLFERVASNPKHQTKEALVFFLQSPVDLAQLDLLVQLEGRRSQAAWPVLTTPGVWVCVCVFEERGGNSC